MKSYEIITNCNEIIGKEITLEKKAKILTYEEYDAKCHYIASNLFNNDCYIKYITISELTEMIINELPDNYFIDTTETLHDEFSKAFTLSEFVDKVSEYLDEMYKVMPNK